MSFTDTILDHFSGRVLFPMTADEIPIDCYMTYILGVGQDVVVVGHGKMNRAKVILDSEEHSTQGHIKALKIRLYNIYRNEGYPRYRAVIPCDSKIESKEIESRLHRLIGGNSISIPEDIDSQICNNIGLQNSALLFVRLALCSYYDGLSDLRRWRRNRLIDDASWNIIRETLKI